MHWNGDVCMCAAQTAQKCAITNAANVVSEVLAVLDVRPMLNVQPIHLFIYGYKASAIIIWVSAASKSFRRDRN